MEVEQAIRELCARRGVPQLFHVSVHTGRLVENEQSAEGPGLIGGKPYVHVILTKNCDEGNWPWLSTYACEDADQAVQMADELIVEWIRPELVAKGYTVYAIRDNVWRFSHGGRGGTQYRSTEAGAWQSAWKHYKKEF
jgi:hypothetical protein